MAFFVLFFGEKSPDLALLGLLLALALFAFSDGVGGVPWTDLVAKSIPSTRRGRLLGSMQSIGGIGAFVAGIFIRQVLATVPFPKNYAFLLTVGFVFLAISLVGTLRVKEREGAVRRGSSLSAYWRNLPRIWRSDSVFQKMLYTRMLLSCFYLALPFYIVFARERLGFAASTVGLFLSAQMAGSILASLLWGWLGDRYDNRMVICLVTITAAATPGLALGTSLLARADLQAWAFAVSFLIFATIGATLSGVWIGFTNYLLDLASDIVRPTYVGMMNTLTAPFTFLPILGGILLRSISHETLFAITLFLISGSIFLAIKLPKPHNLQSQSVDQLSS